MDFSPYVDGQDPNLGTEISEAQLTARMQIIANNTVWVRSFGCTHGLQKFGQVAHSLGLKAAVGAWLSNNLSANDQEISNLISAANAGQVDLAIVGSEVLLRNDLTESQLIGYMNQVRQQIPANIPVATADVYGKLLEHPAVIANSDVVLPNYYPYWEGVSINTSIATLHRQHQLIVAAAQGKPVIVSETGWPSAGNVICNAVPSSANASFYFLNFSSWARANNVAYFYFTSLSETWKANYEGPQGAHWGVWDKDGVLKPGMQAVFDGQTMADNWTNAGVPGGPGSPSMEFTYLPPYGSSNNLFGQVLHVSTEDYKVAVYIYVGGWWTKPTFANPLTNIGLDGSWECDITTGGNDVLATQIVAYLVPKNFSPPPMSGGQTLPPTLDQNAVAKTEIARPGSSPYLAGQVTDSNNQGVNGVTITLTGSQTATTHTLCSGKYSFLNLLLGGNYTVTPSHPSYTFNPSSLTFNNFASSQTGDFVALPNYSIALSASPIAGGTVSGGGTFASGSSRTVVATANTNYTFSNWTENGSVASSSSSYIFTLNSNRTLIANFAFVGTSSTWTDTDIGVGADNQFRSMWNKTDGTLALWVVAANGSFQPSVYGPYAGWTAKAIAAGSDNLMRVLWINTNGSVVLWVVAANGSFQANIYGPYAGWTAADIGVGSDNKRRVLWTNTNGSIALWVVASDGSFQAATYGPYAGWTARRMAAGGDNKSRVLWTNTNGSISLWTVAADGSFQANVYGPYSGWTAADIGVGSDNKTRVLWTNINGSVALWSIQLDGTVQVNTYGPYAGWTARSIAVGADNKTRVLWNNTNGSAALWTVAADGSFQANVYGPY